ncbi:MAG TPA: hypothetical protein VEV85_14630 [Bryobacteraceae bacterium]|nr:hypothetical protein [Bryobacteraceae bacterium]
MRSAIKVTLIVLFSVTVACVVLLMTEYAVRKIVYGQFAMPGRQTELILDRWAAFVNNPNYSANGVRVNAQGFRRAANLSLVKPANTVRIFLLGGSVAYGGETLYPEIDEHWKPLDNNQTVDHYLEARLNSVFPEALGSGQCSGQRIFPKSRLGAFPFHDSSLQTRLFDLAGRCERHL